MTKVNNLYIPIEDVSYLWRVKEILDSFDISFYNALDEQGNERMFNRMEKALKKERRMGIRVDFIGLFVFNLFMNPSIVDIQAQDMKEIEKSTSKGLTIFTHSLNELYTVLNQHLLPASLELPTIK